MCGLKLIKCFPNDWELGRIEEKAEGEAGFELWGYCPVLTCADGLGELVWK